MTSNCQARYEGGGMMRCVTCRVAWDSDDVIGACPRFTGSGVPVVAAPSLVPSPERDGVTSKEVTVATRDRQERLSSPSSQPGKAPFVSGLAPDIFSRPRN